jgi:hypothetical protein
MSAKNILAIALLSVCVQLNAQEVLFKADWNDYSSFKNSGGEIENQYWIVANDSCLFTGAVFIITEPGTESVEVNLTAATAGNFSSEEKIYGFYYVNEELKKTFTASGNQFEGDYRRMDLLPVKAGANVVLKIAVVSTGKEKKWMIKSGDINVTTIVNEIKPVHAEFNGRTVRVNWNYETEKDCNYFIVERSKNGQDFTQVAFVKADDANAYQIIDHAMIPGVNYYRIKLKKFGESEMQIGNVSMLNTVNDLSEALR